MKTTGKTKQNPDAQEANRRPQYNSQGDETDRTRGDYVGTECTICGWFQLWRAARVRFAASTRQKRA
jgi:hypothetical protein